MKEKVKEFREREDEKKADGFADNEFDDFDNDNQLIKEYLDIDNKFCIAKRGHYRWKRC